MNTFDHPYHIHKYLDSELSTFLLVDRYIIFNKFVKHIQLYMIMIYTGALPAKGHRPDLNNGPGETRIVPTFWPQHLFKLNSNNGPSPGYSNLWSDGRYTCPGLLLTVCWWVPHLPKGCRPDFNNGLRGDSNSGPVICQRKKVYGDKKEEKNEVEEIRLANLASLGNLIVIS